MAKVNFVTKYLLASLLFLGSTFQVRIRDVSAELEERKVHHSLEKGNIAKGYKRSLRKRSEKPLISIYYEMLCPPSVDFMAESFANSMNLQPDLHKLAKIRLVPFGNAYTINFLNQTIAICQHEEAECLGNKYNMCALENLSTAKSLRFTACFARQTKAFLDKDLP